MKSWPTLYKKTSTGAIQEWSIDVYQESMNSDTTTIETRYGQLNSDKMQITTDDIREGKNIGKANETSIFEQAQAEAQAKWEKQLKKGYIKSIEAAESGELDKSIEGGIVPMLAHSFAKQGHKIKYPCYVQPKLDGIRCIAILKDGVCTLWSRTRKQIASCPHIVAEIENNFKEDVILDGELYNHNFKANFEHIVHLVRQEEPDPQCTDVEYHIYDLVDEQSFEKRLFKLNTTPNSRTYVKEHLKLVDTGLAQSEENVAEWFETYTKRGYEGAMLRNGDSLYVNKRSYDLLKVKEFQDEEFDICGIEEGRGKLAGHVGAFRCKTVGGTEFLAKMSGETERLRYYFEDHSLWEGKRLTVQFQGLTGANRVPRFPVGLRIRDFE